MTCAVTVSSITVASYHCVKGKTASVNTLTSARFYSISLLFFVGSIIDNKFYNIWMVLRVHGPSVCCEEGCETYVTQGSYVFWAFIDLEKAYDTI